MPLFVFNTKIARQNAKRHRIVQAGLSPAITKAEQRAQAEQAAATHRIRKLPSISVADAQAREQQRKADYELALRIARKIKSE